MILFSELMVAKNNQGRPPRVRQPSQADVGVLCNAGGQTLGQGPGEVVQLPSLLKTYLEKTPKCKIIPALSGV